ncbi:MAG TPA: hypothetical protein VFV34_02735, partial [Blastocatellia bacterium]|nr:hypothetical protein [Blastocatellia bacterium]
MQYCTVGGTNGDNTPAREGSVIFDNVVGSGNSIFESIISGGIEDNVRVENTSGVLNSFTISNNSIQNNSTVSGNIGVRFAAFNSSNMTGVISGNSFSGNRTDTINCDGANSSQLNITISNNVITRGTGGNNEGNLGINVTAGASGQVTFDVDNNKVGTPDGTTNSSLMNTGINIFGPNTATISGKVRNNVIINRGTGFNGHGIQVAQADNGIVNISVDNNTISNVGLDYGIFVQGGLNTGAAGFIQSAVTNNNVSVLGTALDAIRVRVRNASTGCSRITGNIANQPAASGCALGGAQFPCGLSVSQGNTAIHRLEGGEAGLAAGNPCTSQITTFGTITAVAAGFCTSIPTTALPFELAALTDAAEAVGPHSNAPEGAEYKSLAVSVGEAPEGDQVQKLSHSELLATVSAAIERLSQLGITPLDEARLLSLTFELTDLPGAQIAAIDSSVVRVDETAAGYGWFVDSTPLEDSEFDVLVPNKELQTTELSPASGKMDLLTALMRQLGQVYLQGQSRISNSLRMNLRPLMQPTLSAGVRRLPTKQLRVALSPGTGLKPADALLAQSNKARSTKSAVPEVSSIALIPPTTPRNAAFNLGTDRLAPRQGMLAPAVLALQTGRDVSSYAAMKTVRTAALAPAMSGETINQNLGTIPAGKSVTLTFRVTINTPVTPAGTTQVCNQGTVTADTISPVLTNDPDTAAPNDPTCTTLAQADLEIVSKTGVPSPDVPAGSNITYTVSFRNNGPDAGNNVKVTDAIPANTTFVSVGSLPSGWSRTDTVTPGGTGTLMFEKATVANAETATFTVTVQVGGSVAGGTTISNTASTSSDTPDGTQANNSKTATTNVVSQADLSVTKTDGQATAIPGQPVTYTIVVTNNGPNQVTGATIADTFPAALTGVTFTSVAAGGATGNTASGSGNITDTVSMPNGSSITYTATGTINPAATGSLANTATVTVPSGTTDPVPGNNSATDTDTLTPQGDLSITKTDGTTTEIPGTTATYTITVSNAGPSTATGAVVADTFPGILSGVTFTSVASGGATGNTASGSGSISDTLTLPPGSSVTYTVTGTIDAAATGSLSNTATVTAPGSFTDTNSANNSATDTDTLTPQSDLSITKL